MAPLPAMVSDQQTCKYCPQKRNCAVYNRYCFSLYMCHFQCQRQTEFFNAIELWLKCIICVELWREIPWGAVVKVHRYLCSQRASTSARCTSSTSATGCCSARWRLSPWRTKEVGEISGFRLPSRGGSLKKYELYIVS